MCRVLLSKHEFPVTQLQMLSGDTTGPNIETVETRRQVVCPIKPRSELTKLTCKVSRKFTVGGLTDKLLCNVMVFPEVDG